MELRYNNFAVVLSKRCKQRVACENNAASNNPTNCQSGRSAVCFFCCQGDNCNIDLPVDPFARQFIHSFIEMKPWKKWICSAWNYVSGYTLI